MHFTYSYTSFYGQMNAIGLFTSVSWRIGHPERSLVGENIAIQWLHPTCNVHEVSLPLTSEGQVFLAGLVCQPAASPHSIVNTITASIVRGQYQDLATISENAAGCFVHSNGVISLWVGCASKDSIFFRMDGPHIRWSTNPLDLIDTACDMDSWALRRCCHGDDVFIYPSLQRVEIGYLVKIAPSREIETHRFDAFLPDSSLIARKTTLENFQRPTHDALLQAVQPLRGETVGLLLSGGPGSAALLAALKEIGVNTIAYHMESPDPAGSEYHFARLVCEAFDVPLQRILMDTEATYLSPHWMWSHPYGHPWARWYEQVAQQARKDHISLLVTGGGDDSAFGPGMQYGLHSLLSTRIAWREKVKMVRGIFSTDWNIFAILSSLYPTHQLIGPSSLSGSKREDRVMRRADFLQPLSVSSRQLDDIALAHAPCFAPQTMALTHAILQPSGISLYNPYHQRAVQAISLALPDAFKLIPNLFPHLTQARIIDKPALRLAFNNVPQEVMWRTWNVWTQSPGQRFCLNNKEIVRNLLGRDSCLAAMGIADPSRLEQVLKSNVLIRENYQTLITSAMTELFLRNAWQPQAKRGGPVWRRHDIN